MKNKKRKQKVICIGLSILLLAVFLCAQVSAADYYTATFNWFIVGDDGVYDTNYVKYDDTIEHYNVTDWNDLPSVDSTYEWEDPTNSKYTGYGAEWDWPTGDTSGIVSFYIGRSRFGANEDSGMGFSSDDTIWTEPFQLAVALPDQYTSSSYFRISFREVTAGGTIGKYVGTTGWKSDYFTSNSFPGAHYWVFDIPSYQMKILTPGNYYGLSVHIEFQVSSMNGMSIGLGDSDLIIHYGRGSSPDFPIFSKPDTGVEDDFINNSDELIDDYVTGGFESFKSEINAFAVPAEILQGMTVVSTLMTNFVNQVPGFSVLVMLSLTVGILACALGMVGSIVGASGGVFSKFERKGFLKSIRNKRS